MAGAAPVLRLGIALIAAGILFASTVLLFPGVVLVLLILGCMAWVRLGMRGVEVRRTRIPVQVSEGERFEVVYSGRAGWLPLIGAIEDEALMSSVRLRGIRPRSDFELRLEGSIERRGRHELPAPSILLGDPLGIATRRIAAGTSGSILVLPRIEPIGGAPGSDGPALGRITSAPGDFAAGEGHESAADPELDGVRPYRPGTRASRIYWPALARGLDLAERHLAAAADSGPIVVLDPSGAADRDGLDRAVRAAASLTVHLARFGGCELLIGGERRRRAIDRDPRSWVDAHAALAVVEEGNGAPRFARNDLHSAVIWVSACPSPRLSSPFLRGFLVCPEEIPGLPVAFTVAGCHGHGLVGSGVRRVAA